MYKIDELITEIKDNEIREIPGELTAGARERIALTVLNEVEKTPVIHKQFPRKKRHIVLLVAAMLMLLGVTAFAVKEKEWDIAIINYMGLNESDIYQLASGEVIINEIPKPIGEEGIGIREITSLGDDNCAYIRINTNLKLPEGFDEKTDYILPENDELNIFYKNIWGHEVSRPYGMSLMGIYEDGMIGFLMSIENCKNLNRCHVSFKMEDLYWYHDRKNPDKSEEKELLCAGIWETEWTYSYRSNVKTDYRFTHVEGEAEYFLTKIQVSPISVRLEAVRDIKFRNEEWDEKLLSEIHYKNGECILVEHSSAGIKNGIFIEEFFGMEVLGEVLDCEEIDYFIICGQRVDM